MTLAYAVLHEENGVFGVSFPDFPGCVSGGEKEDEAIRRADEALTFHVAGMVEDGDPLPVLRGKKELWKDAGFLEDMKDGVLFLARFDLPGRAIRINISIDEHLVRAIDDAARAGGQSRSNFLAEAARAKIRGAA